jgi:hypothetical protein
MKTPSGLQMPVTADFHRLIHAKDSPSATMHSGLAFGIPRSKPMPSDYVEPSINQDRFVEFLECAEERQEDLRDAREALLGSRFRLQVQRRELLATRSNAASQAGAAFNRLRQYLIELGIDLPNEIELAFSEAETLRNTLGEQEVEYDEAEKAYDLEEWKYTAEETQFINDLPSSAPAPNQPDRSYAPFDRHETSLRFSFGPQDIANIVAESEGPFHLFTDRSDVPLEGDEDLSDGQSTVPGDSYQHVTNPQVSQSASTIHDVSKAYPDGLALFQELDVGRSPLKWAGTRRFIDEWLLNSLDTSILEKSRLKHSTAVGDEISYDYWWELLEQQWFLDTPEGSEYHTGDTTVSDESSGHLSSNAMRRLFDMSDTSELDTQQFPPTPLLAQDRVIDAPELTDFPTNIEPRDLIDITPKRVKFHSQSSRTQSESTHPTIYTRASSSVGRSSHSTTGESSVRLPHITDNFGQTKRRRRHTGRRQRRRNGATRSEEEIIRQERDALFHEVGDKMERLADTTYSTTVSEHHAGASDISDLAMSTKRPSHVSDIADRPHNNNSRSCMRCQSATDIPRPILDFNDIDMKIACATPLPESDTEDLDENFISSPRVK